MSIALASSIYITARMTEAELKVNMLDLEGELVNGNWLIYFTRLYFQEFSLYELNHC